MIKKYSPDQQPREKAILKGIESLSDGELLALIIRTGTKDKSALDLAFELLKQVGGFHYLHQVTLQQVTMIKGIKQAKGIELIASIELAKRLLNENKYHYQIREAIDAYRLVSNKLRFEKQERVVLLCLNTKLEVVKEKTIFIGTDKASLISGKEIFKEAIACGVSRIMIIHNHPSGNPTPSLEDENITAKLKMMAVNLEIELVDHLIVGHNCFYSFANRKIIKVDHKKAIR